MAVAIRGYAPTPPARRGQQVIVFGGGRQPAYAWSFDRGDGLSNIGYGELLDARPRPNRAHLLEQVEALLPGSTEGATDWVGHQLPLSSGRTPTPARSGAARRRRRGPGEPDDRRGHLLRRRHRAVRRPRGRRGHRRGRSRPPPATATPRTTKALLGSHLRHIAVAGRLCRSGAVLDAGLRTSAADKRVFDDLVELGLANGRITPRLVRGLARELVAYCPHDPDDTTPRRHAA